MDIEPNHRLSTSSLNHHVDTAGNLQTVALDIPDRDGIYIDTIPTSQQIYIEVRNLSAFVTSLFAQQRSFLRKIASFRQHNTKTAGKTQILFKISCSIKPGHIFALMGPSGSGKTTMLSIMAGRAQRSMHVEGHVHFNGIPLNKSVKRKLGFVMQDDLLHETLTVYETLYYAAMLRLPRTMTKSQKIQRVHSVISNLGLSQCKDTIVGGFFRRGISGGERKRTSIAHELLINPSMLMLDEPTSGLDATTAMHLMTTLKTLARGGRAIVSTIHQPSSRLYQQLDQLLLLSRGHGMYYGRAEHAVDYFECLGFPCPPRINAADFLLDLASGDVVFGEAKHHAIDNHQHGGDGDGGGKIHLENEKRNGDEDRLHLIQCTEHFLSIIKKESLEGFDNGKDRDMLCELMSRQTYTMLNTPLSHIITPTNGVTNTTTTPINDDDECSQSLNTTAITSSTAAAENTNNTRDKRWGAPYLTQVSILFQRNLRTRRFQSLSTQDIIQFTTISILAGLFWLQKGKEDTVAAARDILGVLFFMLMFLSFRSLFVNLFTFPEEQRYLLKERASGMYRLSAFYLARSLSDFPTDMSIPTAFIIIVYFMAGLRTNAAAFFGVYGTLLLAMFVAQSLGLLLGSYFMNPKTAQMVASVLMLTIVLTGGFFVQNIPAWIAWLRYVSYIYYALGLLLFIEYDGGNRVVWSCTSYQVDVNGSGGGFHNQCVPTNPSNPEQDPTCTPVDESISEDFYLNTTTSLQASLGLSQDPSSQGDAIRDGMVLLLFLVVLRISVYYVLKKKTSGI